LGVTDNSLNFILDQHRNPEIWHRDGNWKWTKEDKYIQPFKSLVEANRLAVSQECEFNVSKNKQPDYIDSEYTLMSKGWV